MSIPCNSRIIGEFPIKTPCLEDFQLPAMLFSEGSSSPRQVWKICEWQMHPLCPQWPAATSMRALEERRCAAAWWALGCSSGHPWLEHPLFVDDFPSYKPPCICHFPLPRLITKLPDGKLGISWGKLLIEPLKTVISWDIHRVHNGVSEIYKKLYPFIIWFVPEAEYCKKCHWNNEEKSGQRSWSDRSCPTCCSIESGHMEINLVPGLAAIAQTNWDVKLSHVYHVCWLDPSSCEDTGTCHPG